ncbi:choline dehydrogenase 4, variant 5 [Schistosoma haematobium]|uniref:Choline dehydrogenase 4, variant 5 n=1 Tax=Schistosoma haematobium TaxID=6185 RepID=A0A922LP78_SCHHA|nr:choline dehydrogenase 4, variant 5 [Schistosoma haematobium]KAH9590828.1 choline dehydrogenase 4, variant 5 [Schistosoma haematobium]
MPKADRIKNLHDLLKHHLLRRLKCDVIQDLPKKTEIIVPVDMTLLQRRLYKYILTNNYEELRCGNLINSIMHLQKVCNHPYLMQVGDAIAPRLNPNDETNGPYEPRALVQVSSKLVVLMELLRGLFVDGHRVLIFSRFTMMLDLLEEVLTNARSCCMILIGILSVIYKRFLGLIELVSLGMLLSIGS